MIQRGQLYITSVQEEELILIILTVGVPGMKADDIDVKLEYEGWMNCSSGKKSKGGRS
jgi:hypothetical protein